MQGYTEGLEEAHDDLRKGVEETKAANKDMEKKIEIFKAANTHKFDIGAAEESRHCGK